MAQQQTPIVTLWPAAATAPLADAVRSMAAGCRAIGPGMYSDVMCPDMAPAGIADCLTAKYRELISMTSVDTTLHAVAVIPVAAPDAVGMASRITEAVSAADCAVTLEIICLQGRLYEVVAGESVAMADRQEQAAAVDAIHALALGASFHCTVALLDDYIATGAPVGFDLGLLAQFLTALFGAFIENYPVIFSPALMAAGDSRIMAFGLTRLHMDRAAVAEYLLHRAFVAALDSVGITQETVDTQCASDRALKALKGISGFYEDFYQSEVVPLLDQHLDEGEIASRIVKPLQGAVDALRQRLTAFMADDTLTLPEKEATLALLLGRDNRRLEGMLYKQEPLYLDDAATAPAQQYIDTFNQHSDDLKGMLPTPDDFPELQKFDYNPATGEYTPSESNSKAFNPLADIKDIKTDMLDLTSFIRRGEAELQQLQQSLEEQRVADRQASGGADRIPPRDIEVVEQPLQEKYVPAAGLKILPSVDLRPLFSVVADQSQIGSCTSFAVAGMYEYAVNRANPSQPKCDMSERFLFYYSNVVNGRPEGGSNFYEQLEVMGQHGICEEVLYPYRPDEILQAPSEAAQEDARNHRVLLARQIPLQTSGDTYDCVTANHRLLTSALSEGFPVGIALKIYDSFRHNTDGYIHRPTEQDVASATEGHHAMVVVGYSEIDKCYIVRNSWGSSWGDGGYCYVSAAYIDDPEFNSFSCIIAETTESEGAGVVPQMVAPFAGTQTRIQMAALANTLDEARLRLQALSKLYTANYAYYRAFMSRLSLPNVRNDIRRVAEDDLASGIAVLVARRDRKVAEFPEKVKEFSRSYIKRAASLTGIVVVYIAVQALMVYLGLVEPTSVWMWGTAAVGVFITVMVWLYYGYARRHYRHELQTEIDDEAERISHYKKQLLETQMRFHVGGMVLDAIHKLSIDLDRHYQRLTGYNANLLTWHDDDTRQSVIADGAPADMFESLNRRELLDRFFDANADDILAGIDLMGMFGRYTLADDAIEQVRTGLEEVVRQAILAKFENFDMTDYLLGAVDYDYVPQPELTSLFERLNRKGEVATRHMSNDSTRQTRFAIMAAGATRIADVRRMLEPYFSFPPVLAGSSDRDSFTLLTMRVIEPEAVMR